MIITKTPKILKFLTFLASTGTAVYTGLIFYYATPLISAGYFAPKDDFLIKYIPYYKNFVDLNAILNVDGRIVVKGSRVNLYHLTRLLLDPFNNKNNCVIYFVVGEKKPEKGFELIYSDNMAVQFTYRTPKKAPSRNQLRVSHVRGV